MSRWAAGLQYEDLSQDAIYQAKRFLLDSIGCALGGYQQHDVKIALEVLGEIAGRGPATVIGTGERVDPVSAALANALMIRCMDYNDIYWKQDPSHPSDIFPAALACCERAGSNGRELIVGLVLGHEFEMRFCEVAFPGIRERGWHHATLTAFVSPMVAGRALHLPGEQIQHAIGISASRHCTLGAVTAGKLTMMKNTVDPMATQSGVFAALLAEKGYSGPEHVVEGKEGLTHVLGPEWKLNLLTDGLGASWRITQCGMKAFPTEALTHTPISAALDLIKTNDLHPDEVEKIQIRSLARAADILSDSSKYDPHTRETADHSLPYVIAAALVERQVTPAQFTMEKILDANIRAQLKKVEVVADPEIEKVFPALQRVVVNITTTDGRMSEQGTRLSQRGSAQPADGSGSGGEVRRACRRRALNRSAEKTERGDLESGEERLGPQGHGADEVGHPEKACQDQKRRETTEDRQETTEACIRIDAADWETLTSKSPGVAMAQTIVEKIAQSHLAEGPKRPLRAGDFLSIRPLHVMTHDNTSAVMSKFKAIGAKKIFDRKQLVFALDHDIQNQDEANLKKYRSIEAFAKDHGVDFYPAGSGIGHQIMVERGYVVPGSFIVASDSHSNMYGALGAIGTPIVRTDAAVVWVTGEFWWQIPRSIQVVLDGKLRPGVTGKDVIITLCGLFNHDEVLNAAVEFSGRGVASLSMDARFSISNMSTEWGPLVGWFPVDEVTIKYLRGVHRRVKEQGIERFTEKDIDSWDAKLHHSRIPMLPTRRALRSTSGR